MDLDELLKEPWIIREEGSGTRIAVERALRRKGRTLKQFNVVMEMGSTSSVKEGVKARLGLAFIRGRATEEEIRQGSFSQSMWRAWNPSLDKSISFLIAGGRFPLWQPNSFDSSRRKRRLIEVVTGLIRYRSTQVTWKQKL